jgi:hypothetical protein
MPTTRSLLAGLALAMTAISCSDQNSPTAPDTKAVAPVAQARTAAPIVQQVTATLSDGSQFVGTVTVNRIIQQGGQLFGVGTIVGTATTLAGQVVQISQAFTAPLAFPPNARCPILHLDLGPIHLDLLGLQVDLSRVVLDIVAQAGAGNLLGNLLCAVAHLLDGGLNLTALNTLLAQINAILGGL